MKTVILKETPLTVEQLDNVTGASTSETADDTRFLNSLNGSTDRYGCFKCILLGKDLMKKVDIAWSKVGIVSKVHTGSNKNVYYHNGKEITQEQARQIAMDVTGHHMTTKDWQW